MTRSSRIALSALGVLALILAGLASMTGLYVVNPVPTLPEGETIWYYRRGLGLPMVSSADGLNIKYSNGVSTENRYAMNAKIATVIGSHVIAKFPYVPSLYLMSTGNKDFSKLGAPGGAPAGGPAKGAEGAETTPYATPGASKP